MNKRPQPGIEWASEVFMAEMTPQVSEVLEKALALSTQERGLLIDHLIESLDEGPAEEGVEQAWDEEIKRRVDDIRSGKVKMIPGEQVLRELAKEFPDEK
jgi:putative addiction module component (TIGR02574 family)